MNSAQLELALNKQRLQLQCASQRADFARHAAGLTPAFALAAAGGVALGETGLRRLAGGSRCPALAGGPGLIAHGGPLSP